MPKRVFWPAALLTMGLIFLASNMGYLPPQFWDFWPLMLIIVGLGGLLTSDREEWMITSKGGKKVVRSTGVTTTKKAVRRSKK